MGAAWQDTLSVSVLSSDPYSIPTVLVQRLDSGAEGYGTSTATSLGALGSKTRDTQRAEGQGRSLTTGTAPGEAGPGRDKFLGRGLSAARAQGGRRGPDREGVARRVLAQASQSQELFRMALEAHCPGTYSCRKRRSELLPEDAYASGGDLALLLCLGSGTRFPGLGATNCASPLEQAGIGRWAGQHEPCQKQGLLP